MKPPIPYPLLIAGLALLSLALAALSMLIGASGGLGELLAMIASGNADTATMILMEVRLPRTLLALMIGATLGLAGASLQGYLRNPLADPGVVGVTSAASLGAVLATTGFRVVPRLLPLHELPQSERHVPRSDRGACG